MSTKHLIVMTTKKVLLIEVRDSGSKMSNVVSWVVTMCELVEKSFLRVGKNVALAAFMTV